MNIIYTRLKILDLWSGRAQDYVVWFKKQVLQALTLQHWHRQKRGSELGGIKGQVWTSVEMGSYSFGETWLWVLEGKHTQEYKRRNTHRNTKEELCNKTFQYSTKTKQAVLTSYVL